MIELYVCSDVHDDLEALRAFANFAQQQEAHKILVLGDLSLRPYTREALADYVKTGDKQRFIAAKRKHNDALLREMKAVLDSIGIPYNVIPGNYDPDFEHIFGEADINRKSTVFGAARVFGYGGAPQIPFHLGILDELGELTPFDHKELYVRLCAERPDIALIHTPPYRLCDDNYAGDNIGTPASFKYITEQGPKLILSGHVHEAGPNGNNPNKVKGVAGIKNPKTGKTTIVINPGNLGRFELVHHLTLEPQRKFDYGTFANVDVDIDGSPRGVTYYSIQPEDKKERSVGKVRELDEADF